MQQMEINEVPSVRDAIADVQRQLTHLAHCDVLVESRSSAQMSIENLLNPMAEHNNQDKNSVMPSDEQLLFNTPNPNTTNEAIQESFEKENCQEDDGNEIEQVPWTFNEIKQACNKIRFSL
ncbi:hypothetical protein O181_000546 [Austropuccinia psidii MF-1]|uniref:Uncharacterized protein n=1 Tax=Austropuccinia psidii MF-1 TaxID=1389203 RepID=A0A9Q3B8Q8_9BASI|nr:hypothetical protein [Austropuccinia psidii MF-1]